MNLCSYQQNRTCAPRDVEFITAFFAGNSKLCAPLLCWQATGAFLFGRQQRKRLDVFDPNQSTGNDEGAARIWRGFVDNCTEECEGHGDEESELNDLKVMDAHLLHVVAAGGDFRYARPVRAGGGVREHGSSLPPRTRPQDLLGRSVLPAPARPLPVSLKSCQSFFLAETPPAALYIPRRFAWDWDFLFLFQSRLFASTKINRPYSFFLSIASVGAPALLPARRLTGQVERLIVRLLAVGVRWVPSSPVAFLFEIQPQHKHPKHEKKERIEEPASVATRSEIVDSFDLPPISILPVLSLKKIIHDLIIIIIGRYIENRKQTITGAYRRGDC